MNVIIFQADTFLIANWILWSVKSLWFWGLHIWVLFTVTQTTLLYSIINMNSHYQVIITKYSHFAFLKYLHEQCNKLHLLNKNREIWVLVQSHPLRRTRFGQYQASSAVLGWPGDGECYLVHNIQSGDWIYSEVLFKALILLVNILYLLMCHCPNNINPNPTNQIRALKSTSKL